MTDMDATLEKYGTLDEIERKEQLDEGLACRWSGCQLPNGFSLTNNGLIFQPDSDKDVEQVTLQPVWVEAISRDPEGESWGRLVCWNDVDGGYHKRAIPNRLFHAQGTELAQTLAEGGLQIAYGKEKLLLRYLTSMVADKRMTAAIATGWLGETFVLPLEALRQRDGEAVVYQPQGLHGTARSIYKRGDYETWRAGIENVSPVLIFGICASLSAPVRFPLNIEAGGFHFHDLTSRGKTTLLQVCSSVWGNGVDPSIAGGSEAYIQRWNATDNALEAKAVSFNDLPMVIDEVGESDPQNFGRTIYRIISGTGRSRADRSGDLRDGKAWRILILSAGEIAVSQFIEQGGKPVKGGQLVRMADINLDNLEPLFSSGGEADSTKRLCAEHFGHVGPLMIETIPDLTEGWDEFDHEQIGPAVSSMAQRVRQRFALVAHVGLLCFKFGIVPWGEEQILGSVRAVYTAWHDQVDTVSDIDRGILAVRDFIMRHESRFEVDENSPPRDRAGWRRNDLYHFTPDAFKEACKGVDPVKVKQALKEKGLLHCTKGLSSRITVSSKTVTVISVKSDLLVETTDSRGNEGNTGNKQEAEPLSANTHIEPEGVTQVIGPFPVTPITSPYPALVMSKTRISNGPLPPLSPLPPNSDCHENSLMDYPVEEEI